MLSDQTPTVRHELKFSGIAAAASINSFGAVHSSWFWPRMRSPPTVQLKPVVSTEILRPTRLSGMRLRHINSFGTIWRYLRRCHVGFVRQVEQLFCAGHTFTRAHELALESLGRMNVAEDTRPQLSLLLPLAYLSTRRLSSSVHRATKFSTRERCSSSEVDPL
jgi:hypothetical protein